MKALLIPTLIALLSACGGGDADHDHDHTENTGGVLVAASLPDSFWSAEASADAINVFDLRDTAKSGDAVVVKGTVQDFVSNVAAFRLVEDTLQSCDEIHGDSCKTPWDYCCADPVEVKRGTTLVEFQENGAPGPWTIKGFHGLNHLSEVVVAGTVHIDDAQNLTIVADSIRNQ
tara:strand:- start:501 stop:1022 length:522 start_codon:yes stop_codon:yes gene_type:complete